MSCHAFSRSQNTERQTWLEVSVPKFAPIPFKQLLIFKKMHKCSDNHSLQIFAKQLVRVTGRKLEGDDASFPGFKRGITLPIPHLAGTSQADQI